MLGKFLKREEGQTTVEYLLIIAVIVVLISVMGKHLQSNIGTTVDKLFTGVNQRIQTLMDKANQ